MATDEAVAQLTEELGDRARALATLRSPDAVIDADRWAASAAPILVAQLAGDDRQAAEACIDLMAALWPDGCDPPPEWWPTPLGRLVARSAGTDDAEAVTYSVAAAMLGVPRGHIGPWIDRGKLDRHPDGGVLRSSILQRLARP